MDERRITAITDIACSILRAWDREIQFASLDKIGLAVIRAAESVSNSRSDEVRADMDCAAIRVIGLVGDARHGAGRDAITPTD